MVGMPKPVDVISVCSANGELRPLRLRLEDESQQMLRVDISQIIRQEQVDYVGAECITYLCRAVVEGVPWLFELRYTLRTHKWGIVKRIY